MKSKKFLFVLVLGLFFLAGWIFCLKKASGIDEIKEQKALVTQAEAYIDKQLYVRGIPLLEDALKIKTKSNQEIQRTLLQAYWDYGDTDSYYALVQVMDKTDLATAKDYLQLAQYDIDYGDIEEALKVSLAGLDKHENPDLRQLYEDYRYLYSADQTEYEEIIPTQDSRYMPAFDGQKWNYVDEDGSETLLVDSTVVTPFNSDGKAVIKQDGRFCVILRNGDLYGIDETGLDEVLGITDKYIIGKVQSQYGFYNYDFDLLSKELQFEDMTLNSCGVIAVKRDGRWGILSDSGKTITDFIYDDVARNSLGQAFAGNRAMVQKDGKWVLIDTEGNVISEASYASAKAPESEEYIAVADENGKWGFIDSEGKQIIDFQYRDAKSFSCGLAAVQVINEWGYVSKQNQLVITDSYQSAEPFHNGYTITSDVNGVSILELSFFDLDD